MNFLMHTRERVYACMYSNVAAVCLKMWVKVGIYIVNSGLWYEVGILCIYTRLHVTYFVSEYDTMIAALIDKIDLF